jgi:hypothetical protein
MRRPPARGYQIAASRCGVALVLAALAGCAPKPIALPEGDGTPYAASAEAFASATAACAAIRSLTAELGLSGRAGRTRLRGRALVGLAAPDRVRLEGLAPFGPPVFILVSHGGAATLLLPRDDRVVRGEAPEAIVEALAGVRVDPASLRSALTGCALDDVEPRTGRAIGDRWLRIETGDGRSVFLEREAAGAGWRVRGARTPAFTLTYDAFEGRRPSRVTIRTEGSGYTAEVRLAISGIEENVALGPEAFEVDVRPDVLPLSLEELRDAGPLGER